MSHAEERGGTWNEVTREVEARMKVTWVPHRKDQEREELVAESCWLRACTYKRGIYPNQCGDDTGLCSVVVTQVCVMCLVS